MREGGEEEEEERWRGKGMSAFTSCTDLRPSALFSHTPQKWNPQSQIHFARVGNSPVLRRVSPEMPGSSGSTWPFAPPGRTSGAPPVASLMDETRPVRWPAPFSSPAGPVVPAALPPPAPDPCATETVVEALDTLMANRKRSRLKGKESQATPPSPPPQETKRRREDSGGSGPSALEPVVANRAAASLVPEPGSPAQRPPLGPSMERAASNKPSTPPASSAEGPGPQPFRNNYICSSYSSSGGIEQLWKRRGVRTSSVSSPDSSASESRKPPWKGSLPNSSPLEKEAPPKGRISALAKVDKAVQVNLRAEAQMQNPGSSPQAPSSATKRAWKGAKFREVCLVITPKEPLIMPPPIQLGYKITIADYNADWLEKLKQFKRGLDSSKDSPPPVEEASPTPAEDSEAIAGVSPGLEGAAAPVAPVAFAVAASAVQVSVAPPTPLPLPGTPAPGPASAQPADVMARPLPLLPPAALMGAATATAAGADSNAVATASALELAHAPGAPSAVPQTSLLFGMLSSPLGSQPTTAATTASPAPSASCGPGPALFPAVFGTLASSESPSAEGAPRAPVLATPATDASYGFQAIFGAQTPSLPASTTGRSTAAGAAALQPIPTSLQPAMGHGQPPSGLSGFSAPSVATTSQAIFGLGPSGLPPASLGSPSAPHPSVFGALAGSSSTAAHPLYPFATLANSNATPGPLAHSAFGPAPPGLPKGALGASAALGLSSSSSSHQVPAAVLAAKTLSPFASGSPASATGALVAAAAPLPVSVSKGAAPEGQPRSCKVAPGLAGFGSPSGFPRSEAQPALGGGSSSHSSAQAPFGGPAGSASLGAKSGPQPSFGTLTSFAPTTAAAPFGSGAQASGGSAATSTGGFTFGGAALPSFPFGASAQPPPALGGTAFSKGPGRTDGSPTPGMLGVNVNFSSGAASPFGSSMGPNALGGSAQSTDGFAPPPNAPDTKPTFGAATATACGRSTPAEVAPVLGGSPPMFSTAGSSTFCSASTAFTASAPAFGSAPAPPSFSIGSGSRMGARQRLQARRQYVRKK